MQVTGQDNNEEVDTLQPPISLKTRDDKDMSRYTTVALTTDVCARRGISSETGCINRLDNGRKGHRTDLYTRTTKLYSVPVQYQDPATHRGPTNCPS